MSIYYLERKEQVNAPIDKVWKFFSSPKNLKALTPDYMGFKIIRLSRDTVAYSGQMIEYRVSVLPGLRMKWLTEITAVKENEFFVDEQRVGPYAIWHHEHHFVPNDHGVEMTDVITYKLPFGWLGTVLHPFVRRKLEGIFAYRSAQTKTIF